MTPKGPHQTRPPVRKQPPGSAVDTVSPAHQATIEARRAE